MAYTKQVREYCLKNQGAVLDVSLVKDGEFSEIPYKTLLKILNRLEEEKTDFRYFKRRICYRETKCSRRAGYRA